MGLLHRGPVLVQSEGALYGDMSAKHFSARKCGGLMLVWKIEDQFSCALHLCVKSVLASAENKATHIHWIFVLLFGVFFFPQ